MSDEPRLPTPVPEGALCAIHPDRPAAQTCVRCGNYMCMECRSGDASGICLTCASRVGTAAAAFPYSREHYSLDGLLNLSLSRWKAQWQWLTLAFGGGLIAIYGVGLGGEFVFDAIATAMGPASGLHSLLHPARLAFQVVSTLFSLAVQIVMLGVGLDALAGEKPDFKRQLERLQRFPECLLQLLVTYVVLALDFGAHFAIFFAQGGMENMPNSIIIPIVVWITLLPVRVYVGLGVMFSMLALLVDPQVNAFSGFAVSWRAVSGHRLRVFGFMVVTTFIVIAGALACCVGIIAAAPIATLMYCALFLALDNRAQTAPALPHEGWSV